MHGRDARLHQNPKEGLLQQGACVVILKGVLIFIGHGRLVHNVIFRQLNSSVLTARLWYGTTRGISY
jgi:hypothetical protein